MKFTDKFIKNLQPTDVRFDKRETNGQGFAIRVAPSGTKTWTFFYHFEGKKRRMDLGNYPELPLIEARKKHQASFDLPPL